MMKELDEWRNFFQNANTSIFDIIDNAILVAARDHPEEFKNRRGLITEKVYSFQRTQYCSQCHNELDIIEQARSDNSNDECENGAAKSMLNGNAGDLKAGCSMDCDVDRSRDDHAEFNHVSKYSYSEAEALRAELDEENEVIGEVLRIKTVLHNSQYESETILFECLRRLQLMFLSVEILQATQIGKAVTALRRHKSAKINRFARELTKGWRITVDDWIEVTEAIAGRSTDSDPSSKDEEGLPSPPLDEVALYATQTPMELSQFFDGIDDDGNPENSTEIDKNHESERIPLPENHNNPKQQTQLTKEDNKLIKDDKSQQIKQEFITKCTKFTEIKPSNTETGREIPQKESLERKINNRTGFKEKSDRVTIHKRPLTDQQAKTKLLADAMVQEKVEAKKNKLPEGDQQVSNAKKQKSVQFIDLQKPIRKLADPMRTNPSNIESSHGRPHKQNLEQKINNETSCPKCPSGITMHDQGPLTEQQATTSLDDEAKFEATTRKLKEKYEQVEKAKMERTTQFMDLHELPKHQLDHRKPYFKRKNQNLNSGKWKV